MPGDRGHGNKGAKSAQADSGVREGGLSALVAVTSVAWSGNAIEAGNWHARSNNNKANLRGQETVPLSPRTKTRSPVTTPPGRGRRGQEKRSRPLALPSSVRGNRRPIDLHVRSRGVALWAVPVLLALAFLLFRVIRHPSQPRKSPV